MSSSVNNAKTTPLLKRSGSPPPSPSLSPSANRNRKSKSSTNKKQKTFNRLDPRFQLQPHHDDEYLFPEELEMIKSLREHFHGTQWAAAIDELNDKFIATFLFARRHDVSATITLLNNFLTKRKEFGFDNKENPPCIEWPDIKAFITQGIAIHQNRAVDKYGRLVYFMWIKNNVARPDLTTLMAFSFWETNYIINSEPLRYLRNGVVWIIDMQGFTWRNFFTSSDAAQWVKSLSGVFAFRVRKIIILNGGMLLRTLYQMVKFMLPKKLTRRIAVMKKVSELGDLIDPKWLLKEYNGECEYTLPQALNDLYKDDQPFKTSVCPPPPSPSLSPLPSPAPSSSPSPSTVPPITTTSTPTTPKAS